MVVLDIETTGLDSKKNCIVSLGALDFNDPKNTFYQECQVDKHADIHPRALEINGFSIADINDPNKPSCEQMLGEFAKWLKLVKDQTIAGQNVHFDLYFINEAADKYGLDLHLNEHIVDLHSLCFALMMQRENAVPIKDKTSNLHTDTILEYVGLPKRRGSHNALVDAELEAEAFSRLIYNNKLLPKYNKF